jgi:hypothetical protein
MSTVQHPSILSKILGFFGQKRRNDSLVDTPGERDSTLTLSEEPTSEEIVRVAAEKNDPHRNDE